jgi:hypothetical protein
VCDVARSGERLNAKIVVIIFNAAATLFIAAALLPLRSQTPESQNTQSKPTLVLDAQLIDTKYCPGDSLGGLIDLTFRLSHHNAGTTTFLLSRDSRYISAVRVDSAGDSSTKSDRQFNMSISWVTSGDNHAPQKLPEKLFVRLSPGATITSTASVRLPLAAPAYPELAGIRPGRHMVAVMVPSWPYLEAPQKVIPRWGLDLQVWFADVWSTTTKFEVESNPRVEKCN